MTPGAKTINRLIATEPFEANFIRTAGEGFKTVVQKTTLTALRVIRGTEAPLNLQPGDLIFVKGEVASQNAGKTVYEHTPPPVMPKGIAESPEHLRSRQFILILEDVVVAVERNPESVGEAMARRLRSEKETLAKGAPEAASWERPVAGGAAAIVVRSLVAGLAEKE